AGRIAPARTGRSAPAASSRRRPASSPAASSRSPPSTQRPASATSGSTSSSPSTSPRAVPRWTTTSSSSRSCSRSRTRWPGSAPARSRTPRPCAPCCTRRATRWAEHGNECPLFRRSCPCEGTRGLRGRRGVVIISPVATVICESGRGPAGEGAYGTESAPEPRHPVTGGTRRCSRAGGHRPLARLGVAMIDVMRRAAKGQVRPRPQPWKELDDSGLVAQFLAGEKRAFSELVGRYQVRLLNFIYRTIGDRDRAEDLVQETFVRVYRHLHRFDQS